MSNLCKKTVFLVLFSLLVSACNQGSSQFFKEEVGGLKLVRLITGNDAILSVNKLHGKEIKVESATIACYQGGRKGATVWRSVSASDKDARQQTEEMVLKMKESELSPFSNYEEKELKGTRIYSFTGMGQQHYIYCIKQKVYWISASPGIIDTIYKGLMN
ncbi:MAG: hypothetical protein LWX55_04015 [Deltaproteobacteria bacterium]|jgi:hypothetical protein|nr:hypothetical protein [Pseudomonadota bacterium]MDL1973946.1 hypothetical protein [Deltaproteobacteria bacterium]OEU54563.1 MAG: hypothetical protein BA868_06485 [Desulfobacterales bacterium C00003106]OEU58983.1 MAG: hypothetical protein BAW33_03790 [Desulfobacterales bacterium C00003104]